MNYLVTGSAGFIGSALTIELLKQDKVVIGVDDHNNYYDPELKENRLLRFIDNPNYFHHRISIQDSAEITKIFKDYQPDVVVNLAAQAGVRYSVSNPDAYVQSNLVGFVNILEHCRRFHVSHFVYASSSSVYGGNIKMPFSVKDPVNHPLSLYGATKKANELLAHSYSSLYNLSTTGLRFFTVYGPWGRPDMALFKFTKSIVENNPIEVYNYGNHLRDFTYIDDAVNGMLKVIDKPSKTSNNWDSSNPDPSKSYAPWRIYNIGNSQSEKLMDYITILEQTLNKKAIIKMLPIQLGDVPSTHADMTEMVEKFDYVSTVNINKGIEKFVEWYLNYYKVQI